LLSYSSTVIYAFTLYTHGYGWLYTYALACPRLRLRYGYRAGWFVHTVGLLPLLIAFGLVYRCVAFTLRCRCPIRLRGCFTTGYARYTFYGYRYHATRFYTTLPPTRLRTCTRLHAVASLHILRLRVGLLPHTHTFLAHFGCTLHIGWLHACRWIAVPRCPRSPHIWLYIPTRYARLRLVCGYLLHTFVHTPHPVRIASCITHTRWILHTLYHTHTDCLQRGYIRLRTLHTHTFGYVYLRMPVALTRLPVICCRYVRYICLRCTRSHCYVGYLYVYGSVVTVTRLRTFNTRLVHGLRFLAWFTRTFYVYTPALHRLRLYVTRLPLRYVYRHLLPLPPGYVYVRYLPVYGCSLHIYGSCVYVAYRYVVRTLPAAPQFLRCVGYTFTVTLVTYVTLCLWFTFTPLTVTFVGCGYTRYTPFTFVGWIPHTLHTYTLHTCYRWIAHLPHTHLTVAYTHITTHTAWVVLAVPHPRLHTLPGCYPGLRSIHHTYTFPLDSVHSRFTHFGYLLWTFPRLPGSVLRLHTVVSSTVCHTGDAVAHTVPTWLLRGYAFCLAVVDLHGYRAFAPRLHGYTHPLPGYVTACTPLLRICLDYALPIRIRCLTLLQLLPLPVGFPVVTFTYIHTCVYPRSSPLYLCSFPV